LDFQLIFFSPACVCPAPNRSLYPRLLLKAWPISPVRDQEHSGTFLATPEKFEGNFSWIYILNRKIEGAILPTKLKREDQSW
jgi:hypothetical protein